MQCHKYASMVVYFLFIMHICFIIFLQVAKADEQANFDNPDERSVNGMIEKRQEVIGKVQRRFKRSTCLDDCNTNYPTDPQNMQCGVACYLGIDYVPTAPSGDGDWNKSPLSL